MIIVNDNDNDKKVLIYMRGLYVHIIGVTPLQIYIREHQRLMSELF